MSESRVIQRRLVDNNKRSHTTDTSKIFSELILESKICCLSFLREENDQSVLPFTPATTEELKNKHAELSTIYNDLLLTNRRSFCSTGG